MDAQPHQPEPFLRVTVGTPISTQDGERLGKVKEIQGRYFKVETSLFQREYWLAAETVELAVPGEEVLLKLDKTQVTTQKQTSAPPA